MDKTTEMRQPRKFDLVREFIQRLGGDLNWEPGGAYGGRYRLYLQGRTVWFYYDGWCPLDTMKVPKVLYPCNTADYESVLREDAFWKLVEIFDRDDVIRR